MAKKTTDPGKPLEFHLKSNLYPIFVDGLNVGTRDDDVTLMRFLTTLPEGVTEQVQLMTNIKSLKGFIDILCSSINYFPTKKQNKR